MAPCSFSSNPKQDVMCKIKTWLVDEKKHVRYYHDWNDKEVRLLFLFLSLKEDFYSIIKKCTACILVLPLWSNFNLASVGGSNFKKTFETFCFMCLQHRLKCWTNTCFWLQNRWCTLLISLKETTSGKRINGKCFLAYFHLLKVLLGLALSLVPKTVKKKKKCSCERASAFAGVWEPTVPRWQKGICLEVAQTQPPTPHGAPQSSSSLCIPLDTHSHMVFIFHWNVSFACDIKLRRVKTNKHWHFQKSSIINSMLKDSLSHEENIFKRFFFCKIHLTSLKYLVLAVCVGSLWAPFESRWVLRDGSDKCCIPTVIYEQRIFHKHKSNR